MEIPSLTHQWTLKNFWEFSNLNPTWDFQIDQIKLLILHRIKERHATATAKSLQWCPTLCDPIDGSPPGHQVPGILQARTLEWVAISSSVLESEKWKWSRSVVSNPLYLLISPLEPVLDFALEHDYFWFCVQQCNCLLPTPTLGLRAHNWKRWNNSPCPLSLWVQFFHDNSLLLEWVLVHIEIPSVPNNSREISLTWGCEPEFFLSTLKGPQLMTPCFHVKRGLK